MKKTDKKECLNQKKVPKRLCVGCREYNDKDALIRIIKKDNEPKIDLSMKEDGRGAYLCRDTKCLELARKRKGMERSLKIKVPDDIYACLAKVIENSE